MSSLATLGHVTARKTCPGIMNVIQDIYEHTSLRPKIDALRETDDPLHRHGSKKNS